MNSDKIRDAVHHLVQAAPQPRPLPDTAPAPLPSTRSHRWVAIVGSGVVIAGGAVAIAAWPSGESEAPVVSQNTFSVSPPASIVPGTTVAPPTQVGPSSSAPSIPAPSTSAPASTVEQTQPSTAPPGEVTTYPVQIPAGQFAVAPDDLVITHLDGDLYWYPGALTETPGEPVLLVDMADPGIEPEEGPGANVIDAVAGTVNGSFVYGTCCEPVSGNVFALDAVAAQPTPLAPGYWPVLSPDGTRLATLNFYSLEVWDLAGGQRTSRAIDVDPNLGNAQQLVWSRDGSALFTLRFDEDGWELVRMSTEPPFAVTASAPLEIASPISSSDTARLVGTDPDGMLVAHLRSSTDEQLVSFDPTTLTVQEGVWSRVNEGPTVQFALSPDGTRMLEWAEAGVEVRQLDGSVSSVLERPVGIRQAWFVPVALR
jgi:hypothetical protein